MRKIIPVVAVAAALALPYGATAATRAPVAGTVTIVIPAFPAGTVSAAIQAALRHLPNFRIIRNNGELTITNREAGESPRGAANAPTPAPASASITIVVPAFPAGSISAAIHAATKNLPQIEIIERRGEQRAPEAQTKGAPPGVLKFAPGEVNRSTTAVVGWVVSVYRATLPDGGDGYLIAVRLPNAPGGTAVSVVQPDSPAFSLRRGERVLLVRSSVNGWARVLPYNGPKLSDPRR